jgi:hypothetical protein
MLSLQKVETLSVVLKGLRARIIDDAAGELRRNPYVVNVIATWPSPQDDSAAIEWVRRCGDGFAGRHPRREYINFSGADPTDAGVAFDERVLAQLQSVKREYDPAALFG